jgi:hypothetical protein
MAIIDTLTLFTTSSGQTITSATTTNSTDTIDLAPLSAPSASGASNSIRDIGTGAPNYLVAYILTTSTVTTVTSPTIRFDIQTADDTGFSTNASVISTGTALALPATTAAIAQLSGPILVARLPTANFRRYNRLQIVTGGTITTASYVVVAGLQYDASALKYYADAITIQ